MGGVAGGGDKLLRRKWCKFCVLLLLLEGAKLEQAPGNIWLPVHSTNTVRNADLAGHIPTVLGEGRKGGGFKESLVIGVFICFLVVGIFLLLGQLWRVSLMFSHCWWNTQMSGVIKVTETSGSASADVQTDELTTGNSESGSGPVRGREGTSWEVKPPASSTYKHLLVLPKELVLVCVWKKAEPFRQGQRAQA